MRGSEMKVTDMYIYIKVPEERMEKIRSIFGRQIFRVK